MTEHQLSRRTFVALTAAAVTTTAGCIAGSGDEAGGTASPTAAHTEENADDHSSDEGGDGHHEEETHHEEDTHHDEETETDPDESDDHTHGVPEEPSASATVNLVTTDAGYHFDPHVVWVEPGGTVTFHNESGSHTATAYAPEFDKPRRIPEGGVAFDTGTMTESGAEHDVTFETRGVYDYYCAPHEAAGMIATVVVGSPDAHEATGLTEPQSSLSSGAREKINELNEMVHGMLDDSH